MIDKFKVAFIGLVAVVKNPSVLLQVGFMVAAIGVGWYFQFIYVEWLILAMCCGLVITTEMINTCIEKVCDVYSTEYDERIKTIKDMSAGAVLFAALLSLVVGIIMISNHI